MGPASLQLNRNQVHACSGTHQTVRRVFVRQLHQGIGKRSLPIVAVAQAPSTAEVPSRRREPNAEGKPSSSPALKSSTSNSDESPSFSWTKQWWPVAPLSALDPAKPYPVTLLGHNYVVWLDPNKQQWRLMEDRCPHRLAPLSEGRIEPSDGTLMCSYHGWRFNGDGSCANIPQIGDEAQRSKACGDTRACVRTYPTQERCGLLFAWLESGPAAEVEAAAKELAMPEGIKEGLFDWSMSETPVDFPFWLEQGMDPTHANFLHHSCGFPMSNALPMEAALLPPTSIDLTKGFTWHHGAYDKKAEGMEGMRQFVAPHLFWVSYSKGLLDTAAIYATPVSPGRSRVFARFKLRSKEGQKASPLMKLASGLPHWVFSLGSTKLVDQDTVINSKQEMFMKSRGLSPEDYVTMARADLGVRAAASWFKMAGYNRMWQSRLGSSSSRGRVRGSKGQGQDHASFISSSYEGPDEARLTSQWDRHTKHCTSCQKGIKVLEGLSRNASLAALLLGVLSISLAVAGQCLVNPGVLLAAVAAGGCAWLSQKVKTLIYDRFINSKYVWQADGGLSLVKGDPIRLPPSRPGSLA